MGPIEYIIIILNAALALGCGWYLAKRLAGLHEQLNRPVRILFVLLGLYFLESFAFSASMASDVGSLILAVVWGGIIARSGRLTMIKIRQHPPMVLLVSLYSSLPAASILIVPILMTLGGWSVLSAEAGDRFGIPTFLPWPTNTILGFFVMVAAIGVIDKVLITTGMVRFLSKTDDTLSGSCDQARESGVTQ